MLNSEFCALPCQKKESKVYRTGSNLSNTNDSSSPSSLPSSKWQFRGSFCFTSGDIALDPAGMNQPSAQVCPCSVEMFTTHRQYFSDRKSLNFDSALRRVVKQSLVAFFVSHLPKPYSTRRRKKEPNVVDY